MAEGFEVAGLKNETAVIRKSIYYMGGLGSYK